MTSHSPPAPQQPARQPAHQPPRPRHGRVVPLHAAGGVLAGDAALAAAAAAWAELERHLGRSALAARTVTAYRRQARAYLDWLAEHAAEHPDAFADQVGAEGAVTAWRRQLLQQRAAPASVNQALAAVEQLYEHGPAIRIVVPRARVPRPGAPEALTDAQAAAVQRAADRRGARDAAIIALLRYTGARVAEAARLDLVDVAITARTGTVRLHGKGDQVRTVPLPAPARDRISAWIRHRGPQPAATPPTGPRPAQPDEARASGARPTPGAALWVGQRGRLTAQGITEVVLGVGADAGLAGLRPHRLRHTYGTRLRQGGADPAQIQALLGHASIDTTARYFRAGPAEVAGVVDRIFQP